MTDVTNKKQDGKQVMSQMELTVVREQNGSLSLFIKDSDLGVVGEHRGSHRLAENHNHEEFYRAVNQAFCEYNKKYCNVIINDAS